MTAVLTTTAEDIVNGALRLIGEIDANQPTDAPAFCCSVSRNLDIIIPL